MFLPSMPVDVGFGGSLSTEMGLAQLSPAPAPAGGMLDEEEISLHGLEDSVSSSSMMVRGLVGVYGDGGDGTKLTRELARAQPPKPPQVDLLNQKTESCGKGAKRANFGSEPRVAAQSGLAGVPYGYAGCLLVLLFGHERCTTMHLGHSIPTPSPRTRPCRLPLASCLLPPPFFPFFHCYCYCYCCCYCSRLFSPSPSAPCRSLSAASGQLDSLLSGFTSHPIPASI